MKTHTNEILAHGNFERGGNELKEELSHPCCEQIHDITMGLIKIDLNEEK